MLQIKTFVKNVYYINYETARDYPQKVLEELKEIFNLNPTPSYNSIIFHQGFKQNGVYADTKYDPISLNDLIHINAHLDKKLERKIGYRLVNRLENIDR